MNTIWPPEGAADHASYIDAKDFNGEVIVKVVAGEYHAAALTLKARFFQFPYFLGPI